MSRVVAMRLKEPQMERLRRLARRLGWTPSEAAALLVEEGLRRQEFGCIDFRESPVGRQAYVQGTSLAVWEVLRLARSYEMDVGRTAEHLRWPGFRVQAALNYAAAFPDEVDLALQDDAALDFTALSRMLPQAEKFIVSPDPAAASPPAGRVEKR
jgi:hypothetical protein